MAQMRLAKDDDVVQAFAANGPDPGRSSAKPFCHGARGAIGLSRMPIARRRCRTTRDRAGHRAASASPSATSAAPKLTGTAATSSAWTPSTIRSGRRSRRELGDPAEAASLAAAGCRRRRAGSARRSRPAGAARRPPAPAGRRPRRGRSASGARPPAASSASRKLIGRYRRASASATAGCTSALTSPPNRATSRTRLELR